MRITTPPSSHPPAAGHAASGKSSAEAGAGFAGLLAAALPETTALPAEAAASPATAAPPEAADMHEPLVQDSDNTDGTADSTAQAGMADAAVQALLLLTPAAPAMAAVPDAGRDTASPQALTLGMIQRTAPPIAALNDAAVPPQAAEAESRAAKSRNDSRNDSHNDPSMMSRPAAALPAPDAETAAAVRSALAMPAGGAHFDDRPLPEKETATAAVAGTTAPSASVTTDLKPAQTVMHVSAPFSSSRWEQAFGEQVLWAAHKDLQSASLTLNPPALGPVRIELQLIDAQAVASFSSHQPEVRKAIEDALPTLKALFADAGLQLQQANVGSGDPRQSDTGEREEQRARSSAPHTQPAPDAVTMAIAAPVERSSRLLDTFA